MKNHRWFQRPHETGYEGQNGISTNVVDFQTWRLINLKISRNLDMDPKWKVFGDGCWNLNRERVWHSSFAKYGTYCHSLHQRGTTLRSPGASIGVPRQHPEDQPFYSNFPASSGFRLRYYMIFKECETCSYFFIFWSWELRFWHRK